MIAAIHELGKVLATPLFGSLIQLSVVGDTFPVACKFHPSNVNYEERFYESNPKPNDCDKYCLYYPHCGFDFLEMSYGHDEYLSNVLETSFKFPPEGIYLVRYHSFYPWHSPFRGREYDYFANERDWHMRSLLKLLKSGDMYSKTEDPVGLGTKIWARSFARRRSTQNRKLCCGESVSSMPFVVE